MCRLQLGGDGRGVGRLECIWYSAVPSIYLSAGCLVWSGLLVVSPCVLPGGLNWRSRQTVRVCLVVGCLCVGRGGLRESMVVWVCLCESLSGVYMHVWSLFLCVCEDMRMASQKREKRPLLSVLIDIEALVDKSTAPRLVASIKLWQLPGVCKLRQGHVSIFSSPSKSVTSLMMKGGSLEAIKENILAWLDIEPGKMWHLMCNISWKSAFPIYLFSLTEGNFIAHGYRCKKADLWS